MNSNESRCTITKCVNFKNNFKSSLQRQYPGSPVRGDLFSDFELAWLYNGPLLRIFDAATGTLISSWDFTTVTHDSRTEITSIIEYYIPESSRSSMKENQLYFIVSYTSRKDSSKASFISLCHPRTSRVLHTITTKEKVTCLSLITARKDHASPIAGIVKLMCGALAVGTTAGNLLIVDIKEIFTCARQGCVDRKQNRFSEMVIMEFKHNENNIREKLNKSDEFHHVAVSLPITDRKEHEDTDLEITALTYMPRCTMLAVGLKNGVFQLWDVSTLKKLHRSGVSSTPTPVVKFGFQEPCNDPQSFCYLWVLYESQAEQNDILPFAIMYACLFKKIITVPEYGSHYRNFVHCKKRFDLDIDMERSISGRCITCSVVSNTPSNILRHVTSVEEDASKINLFVMVFETWEQVSDCNSCITLIIFDMNQWYKAQMPQLVYQGGSVQFVNFQVLEHLSERKGTVMDMRIKKDTIQQFLSFNLSEEYSYPSSLSFDTLVLTDSKLVHARLPGAQRNVLDKIVLEGPSGIINPNKYFSECKDVGLFPYFSNGFNNLFAPSQVQQRNFILTLLLEHKFSSFLVSCVKQWADGSRGVSGCTLPNLIRWAWDCVTRIKQLTDTVCIPLFDYSGDDLDRENYQKLKHCVQLMHTIRDLLTYIFKNYKQYLMDESKLKHQVDALKLITKYFDTIIWCLDCNLLPEKVTSSSEKCVPTYMMNLMQYTVQRRDELSNVITKNQYFVTENIAPYIIDSILEHEANGKKMHSQWERESNGLSNGSYPPVTLQSLLRMFLMPGLSNDAKNFIMIYFILDVCDYHRDEDMKEQLLSFSVVFSIESAFFSLVHACWFVDHEKFEDATDLLLNDAIISQLKSRRELYRTLMLACVCQGQYQLALRIEKLAKLSRAVFNDDTFSITVLLLNGLVMDAYFTMKENPVKQKKLLRHFFKVCDNLGYLKELFKFPLSSEEEEEFMIYLDICGNKDAGDLKVMYLLSRGRYVEAIDVNHQLGSIVPKFGVVGQDTTTQKVGVGRTTTRDILVNAFGKTLPVVTNDLINFCRKEKNKIARFKTVAKPIPLSVVVHTDTSYRIPIYKSSFETVMEAAIFKTAETWTNVPEILKRRRGQLDLKNTPFLRSNFITPRKNASLYSDKEKLSTTQEKNISLDIDEPPTKRAKKSFSGRDNNSITESTMNDELTKLSASVETSSILCTPHVQKRLNKLLRNTPESSPLTSILKSAESRFKQPQKVGFSVPETDRRRSTRLSSNQSKSLPKKSEENTIKDNAELTIEHQKNSSLFRERTTSSASESQNSSFASTAQDSFYSLDSESDGVCSITDFIGETSIPPSISNRIEVMSEDEIPPSDHTTSKLVMECMSEEETSSFNTSKLIFNAPHEEKVLYVNQASKLIIEKMSIGEELPIDRASSSVLENVTKENTQTPDCSKSFIIEGTRSKNEPLQPTRLQFDDIKREKQTVQVEIHAPPSTITDNEPEIEEKTASFTALQPLQESSIYEINDCDKQYSETCIRENFSIETVERETVLEQHSQELEDESDSDIEILEESSSDSQAEEDYSNSVVSNDDLSEKTNESDYSCSQNSERIESDNLEEENELRDIESIDVSTEKEGEVSNTEEEDEVDVAEEEEQEIEDEEDDEEVGESIDLHDLSDEEGEDEKNEENMDKFSNEHLDIDYDSLKAIMSTVNAAETNKIESAGTELKPNHPSFSTLGSETVISPSEALTVPPDMLAKQTTPTCSVSTERNDIITDIDLGEMTNESNISVETLSVSCVNENQTANEPQLVFYFGENSVTSISEKLLTDESMNQSQSEVVQKADDLSIAAAIEKENVEIISPTDSDIVENMLHKPRRSTRNVKQQSFDQSTQKTEDFSIIAVIEEHEGDIEETESSNKKMDVSRGATKTERKSVITVQERKIENYSISAQSEKYNDSSEEVNPLNKKMDALGEVRKNSFGVQNVDAVEMDQTEDFSIVVIETEKHDVEEWSLNEDIISDEAKRKLSTALPKVEHGFESTRTCTEAESSTSEVDKLNKMNESQWKLMQSQNVSIGLVEEMVGTQTSKNSSDLFTPGQTATRARMEVDMRNLPTKKDSLGAELVEEVVESRACVSKPMKTDGCSSTIQIPTHCERPNEATIHHYSPSGSANEEYSCIERTSAQVHDVTNVTITRSKSSEDVNRTLLCPAPPEDDIIEVSESRTSPNKRESAHESPARKAESEYSYSMSIPDSPTGMFVTHESRAPSRRSVRIARKQSTENILPTVTAETVSITTRATRRGSTDSIDVESDVSVTDSATSGKSKSRARKRSFSKLVTRKSSTKTPSKGLKVIKSDEELSDVNSVTDDDRLSSISKASSLPRKSNNRRSSNSKLNTAILQTPSPPLKKRVLREFVSTSSGMTPKTNEGDYENYADSRRLTRSQQKSLLEYGVTRVPTGVESPTPVNIVEQGSVLHGKTDEKSIIRTRTSTRQLKEKSLKREDERSSKSGKPSKRDKTTVKANSDSSDDSSHSRASAASRRAKSGRRSTRTGTHLELRKSSVRPQFKPLSVIPSDEESVSHSVAEDEPSVQASPPSVRSQTTRSMRRIQRNESEQSDRESLHSDVSGSPSTRVTRSTRRSLAFEETAKPATKDLKSILPPQKKKK